MDVSGVVEFLAELPNLDRNVGDAARIDLLRNLEEVKAACAGVQARVTADLDASIRASRAERDVPVSQRGRGIANQVALARRDSPFRGGRHLGMATALVHEMPCTLALLERGVLSEWRATILVRETACLTREDRTALDHLLCADPATLDGLGDQAVCARVRAAAAEVDAEAMVRRARKAVSDRRVTSRPAPDTMAYVSDLLPVAQGVAVHATLARDADSILAAGDDRTRSQIMADLLVSRVTGAPHTATAPPITVNLVISDRALLGGGSEPAHVQGYGPIPAALARHWISEAVQATADPDTGDEARVTLRRLYANPGSGALTATESQARCFPAGLARMIDLRDRTCRTPWCDAPIRHHDHIQPREFDGPTTAHNGAGLCAACNYAKQGAGWHSTPRQQPRGQHKIEIYTPTGHRYQSTAPPLPKPLLLREVQTTSNVERILIDFLHTA
ncbi:HNH endonuclease [Rhodococcus sp. NPDC056960]|uniref:HNH endonuclease n=1 Tax=Rhodococcus sp. NPDC056960 TaxID=3345982 RepID=UPI003634DCD3